MAIAGMKGILADVQRKGRFLELSNVSTMTYDGLVYTGTKVRPELNMRHNLWGKDVFLISNGSRSGSWRSLRAVQTGKQALLKLRLNSQNSCKPLVRENRAL